MYILKCADGSYYTGSTKDLERRLAQHQAGEGANHTKKHLPVKLVYFEEFQRIDEAFYREKQVQGWSRKKKEALINGDFDRLSHLARNYTQYPRLRQAQSQADQGTEPAEVPDETNTENKTLPVASAGSATLQETVPNKKLPNKEFPNKKLPEPVEGNDHKNNLKGLGDE